MPDAISVVYRCEKKGDANYFERMFSTEENVLLHIKELKRHYDELRMGFRMSRNGVPIDTVRDFMKVALQQGDGPVITLTGSGKIAGLAIHDGVVEYDLSEAHARVHGWDYCVNGDGWKKGLCWPTCLLEGSVAQDREMVGICTLKKEMGNPLACPSLDPRVKNSEGKLARPLDALIEEALR
jgi:hypothetical protein